MPSFIPPSDGYTEKGFIDAVPQLHDSLRFKYRPVLIEDGSEFFEQSSKLKAREADRRTARLLSQHITEWDLRGHGEDILPRSPATFLRLNRRLFQRLAAIVLGTDACDCDPAWTEDEKDDYLDAKCEAAASGKPVGAVREDRDQKN